MATTRSWDEILKAAPKYLSNKFDKLVSKKFMKYIEEEEVDEENIDYITDDLEEDWESSNIIDEIGNECNLNDDKRKLLFESLRILFGLDEGDINIDDHISLLHDLDFNTNSKHMKEAIAYMTKQCPNLMSKDAETDRSFIKALAVGRQNKIELLPLLSALYSHWKLNRKLIDEKKKKKSSYTENDWFASSKYLASIKQNNVKQLIVACIRSYGKRILPTVPGVNILRFDDSVTEYIKTITCASTMINNLIKSNKQCLPLLIDLWIIPKGSVHSAMGMASPFSDEDSDDDDDDDDDDSDDDDEKEEDEIGDIDKLLKKDKIKYQKVSIDCNAEAQTIRAMRENVDKILKNGRSKRIVIVVDRRNGKGNAMYIYQPPPPYDVISNDFGQDQLIHHTSSYLMPGPDDDPIGNDGKIDLSTRNPITGKTDYGGRMFCTSFQIHSSNKIVLYQWMNAFAFRFFPEYLVNVLPNYFKENDLNKNNLNSQNVLEKFSLKCTDPIFDAWNKKINDKLYD